MLHGKTIGLCVTGGIAAYKAVDVTSKLVQLGATVHVAMTRSATEFVTPLTFRTLAHNPVILDMFAEPKHWNVEHIALAERADLFVIAPATANIIGKLASGVADDFISTTLLATRAPVLVVPAMNHNMYAHPIVRQNISRLQGIGYHFMEPEYGRLASGAYGQGRFPGPEKVVEQVIALIAYPHDLVGRTVVVSAGPTVEPLDPVRYLSNRSSGKMGYALAAAARDRGARVVLVTGPVSLRPPLGVKTIHVETASELRQAMLDTAPGSDAVIMAAAVADFAPKERRAEKIKRQAGPCTLELTENPDIIKELAGLSPRPVLVAFAAETTEVVAAARAKLEKKGVDLVFANDVSRAGIGFGSDDNQVTLVSAGATEEIPLMPKTKLAHVILDRVKVLWSEGR
ncbi:MAG: bifunctional phosphopantothenoylcysteine decarboxylase/phosphopantothenate--cysteine ligase CoaBC [Bacillota bacterium]